MSEIEYSDLLFEISTKIGVNQLERLVFMCRKQISKGSERTIQNARGLFEELEKRNNLGIDRLETLKQILTQLRNRSMLKKVEEFEIKRKAQSVGIIASLKQAAVNVKGVQAETPAALKELWDIYKDGTLQSRLQEFLVTDDIKHLVNGENVEMTAFINEQEYKEAYLDLLQKNQDVPDIKEEERLWRNSDSFLCSKLNEDEVTLMKLKQMENKLSFERKFHEEEIMKLKEKIVLTERLSGQAAACVTSVAGWIQAPNVEQEEWAGRRPRRNSDSFLCFKPNENEIALKRLMEETEEKWRKEKEILELRITELEETLKAERTSNLNQTTTLGRPLERRRRNSDSDLYYKARKREVEQTENEPERAFEDGAEMDFDKRMFVENYLQNIHETHSMTTETSDSGITTLPTLMLDIFTKRWQTMDLLSMMRELKRTLGERQLDRRDVYWRHVYLDIPTIQVQENLSCLIRFVMHEEPTNE